MRNQFLYLLSHSNNLITGYANNINVVGRRGRLSLGTLRDRNDKENTYINDSLGDVNGDAHKV